MIVTLVNDLYNKQSQRSQKSQKKVAIVEEEKQLPETERNVLKIQGSSPELMNIRQSQEEGDLQEAAIPVREVLRQLLKINNNHG